LFTTVIEKQHKFLPLHAVHGGHVQRPESKRLHSGEDRGEPQSERSHRACRRLYFTYYFSLVMDLELHLCLRLNACISSVTCKHEQKFKKKF